MLRIAHRGAKGHAPENTLPAFRKAIGMGADGIELDVHLSADGRVAVFHDATLERLTGRQGTIAETPWDILCECRVAGESIPSLEDVLDLVGPNFLLNIELKAGACARPVMDILGQYVAKGYDYRQFLISSFDWLALQHIRTLHPEIPVGVLTETDLGLAVSFARTIRAETIHPYFHLLDAGKVRRMQAEGYRVYAWTLNEPGDIARIKSYHVDGIIGDYPERL